MAEMSIMTIVSSLLCVSWVLKLVL